jgi:hypothetical protein
VDCQSLRAPARPARAHLLTVDNIKIRHEAVRQAAMLEPPRGGDGA